MLIRKEKMDLKTFYDIVIDKKTATINKKSLDNIDNCYNFLKNFSKDKIIYGINTGFGPMAQYKINSTNYWV